ncbi:MAG: hypothetical protein K0U64_06880 [Actinomycetia bacterium]|nr:hypothetical protein [Actinomycetes bacterium]
MTAEPVAPASPEEVTKQTERWFTHRGLPHFIFDYSASQDVWTRALPALAVLFLVNISGGLRTDRTWVGNTIAALVGLLIGLGAWALVNRLKGRRWLQLPQQVGWAEFSVFVFVPLVIYLVVGAGWQIILGQAILNLILLGVIYVLASFAVIATVIWGIRRLFSELSGLISLVMRALPLLLIFNTFLFLNAEMWQVGARMSQLTIWLVVILFLVLGTAFLMTKIPNDMREVLSVGTWRDTFRRAQDTPASALAAGLEVDSAAKPDVAPLSRRETGNLGLVLLWSYGVQVLLVTLVIGFVFVLIGAVLIPTELIVQWTGDPSTAACATWFGFEPWCPADGDYVVTQALLRVSGFVAAFSGLYFTVFITTDQTYRAENTNANLAVLRSCVAARAVYRRSIVERKGPSPVADAVS